MTKEEDILRAFTWTKENIGPVHILINNAGIYRSTPFSNFKSEDAKSVFDLNVVSLTIATREALKLFKESDISGHIININSVAGHNVAEYDGIGVYTASKHAVTALSKSLNFELRKANLRTKITVSRY